MSTRFVLVMVLMVAGSSVTRAVAPGAPQNLTAVVSGNTVTLTWNAPFMGGVPTGYVVNASLSPGGAIIATLPVSGTSLVVTDVPSAVYYVHVRAVNLDGESPASNEVIVAVPSGGSSCTSPPNAPTNLSAGVAENVVTLSWSAPVGGCAPTSYVIQAGSAPGLSNLAVLNVGSSTSLTVSAPPGTYFVRAVAVNAFGGSVPSIEIIVTVGEVDRVVVQFDDLTTNSASVTSYEESDFAITPTGASWVALTSFGNPAPFIQFSRAANEGNVVGEVVVAANGGSTFRFESVDLYSSVTTIPHEILGLRNGSLVFNVSGTVPNTFGRFVTITNPQVTSMIDTLVIRLSNPPTPCCANPVGLDNIVLVR
jgi:Fibronectin type III domain